MIPHIFLALALLQDPPIDVTDIDLDDLVKVRVSSLSKKDESLARAAAAIYVIRSEDLKRTGATTLADALRGVPGIEVARSNSYTWSVSARGFNSGSNKLLVLVDGRSVYSPLHAGVFWDVQDLVLHNIDRIEVIRGPGGTLWGSNAVNGIINVITKPAADDGLMVAARVGTEERFRGSFSYGFKPSDDWTMRVFGKYAEHDDLVRSTNPSADSFDGWYQGRTGFRADWNAGPQDKVTIHGTFYVGQEQSRSAVPMLVAPFFETITDRTNLRGGFLSASWDRTLDDQSDMALRFYYDYVYRSQELFRDLLHTIDLDFHHRTPIADGHELTWGANARLHMTDLGGSFTIQWTDERDQHQILSVFAQDEITLSPNLLKLTVGTKLEYNDYTGLEYQPSVRLAWTPDDAHMAWASVSRAVRTPSIIDVDFRANAIVTPGPTVIAILGDPSPHSEALIAFETGYRVRPAEWISLDAAAFINVYDHLRTIEPGTPFAENDPAPAHLVIPLFFQNQMAGRTYGIELASNLQVADGCLVQANYSYLRMNLDPEENSQDTTSEAAEGQSARSHAWVRVAMDLSPTVSLDVIGRYVSRLSATDVDPYVEGDLRLAWRDPTKKYEVSLVGQNLLRPSHAEAGVSAANSEVERGVYVNVKCQF